MNGSFGGEGGWFLPLAEIVRTLLYTKSDKSKKGIDNG